MFEYLSRHRKIVVTGPQRSGTRIASKMIAADTGHAFVDERAFRTHDVALWRQILTRDKLVVQSPGMFKEVLDDPPPDIFVVVMRRPLDSIHASEDRIEWERNYRGNTLELKKFGLTKGKSADIKYERWAAQPQRIPHLELDYDSLRTHPLFVEDHIRRAFGPLQTEV